MRASYGTFFRTLFIMNKFSHYFAMLLFLLRAGEIMIPLVCLFAGVADGRESTDFTVPCSIMFFDAE